jgi:hypothetical protein
LSNDTERLNNFCRGKSGCNFHVRAFGQQQSFESVLT